MNQTSIVKCPKCESVQQENIFDLTMDTGDMEGTFPHICNKCKIEFTVKFEFLPNIKTY